MGDLGLILGSGRSLEKEMVTHCSNLASKIPWTEEPGVHGVSESQTRLSDFTFFLSEYNSSINVNHNRMDFFWSYYTFDTVHSRFTFHKELSYFHMYFHMCLFGM